MNVAEVASVISSAVVSGDDDGALFDETAGAYKHLRTRTEEMIVEMLASNMREELKAYSRMLVFSVSPTDARNIRLHLHEQKQNTLVFNRYG